MAFEERRKHKRKTIKIDVECHISAEQKWVATSITNISLGGLCLITNEQLSIHTKIDLVFYLNELESLTRVVGEIVWTEYDLDKEYYLNGVCFTDVPQKSFEVIQKYIEANTFDVRK
jgi:hypothetical protein